MTFIDLAKKTGGLAATTAIVAGLALSAANPAQARVNTGAAVGIGLGAFAVGKGLIDCMKTPFRQDDDEEEDD